MKRNRVRDVEMLIERHKSLAEQLDNASHYHALRSKELESYLYELKKPGFKINGWYRYTGSSSRIEPYLVTASEDAVIFK